MTRTAPIPQNAPAAAASAPPRPTPNASPKAPQKGDIAARDFSMAIALLVIWGYFALATHGDFVSAHNLSNLAVELSITAVVALGQLLIILASEIDLSVGSGVGLFGGVAAVLISLHGWNPAPAMLVATVAAVGVWLLMGTLIVTQKMPSFIITLAGLLVFRGLEWKIIDNQTIPVTVGGRNNLLSSLTTWHLPPEDGLVLAAVVIAAIGYGALNTRRRRAQFGFTLEPASVAFSKWLLLAQIVALFTLVCNQDRGIPLAALILAVAASVIGVITRHTRFGRYLYAIGGNHEAALLSGIPVKKIVIGAFGIMGLLVAVGGFMASAYVGSTTTTTGDLLELDAIAACVIGGTSLRGGRGTVLGVIFGALIMASLVNGMTLLSLDPYIKYIARGTVLALAVFLDVKLTKP